MDLVYDGPPNQHLMKKLGCCADNTTLSRRNSAFNSIDANSLSPRILIGQTLRSTFRVIVRGAAYQGDDKDVKMKGRLTMRT